ncbi:zinc-binding metallopeptidase family protein [Marinagarivorans algicola]|uniref:zinc-binding metallopeptidase family protein n=1 Tax=Marinagarivorans algicola TaxID=1513270 RepID=UPI0006B5B0E0|nr:putative zinc-binding metallopeptidase [Marinagarivorans algicola]
MQTFKCDECAHLLFFENNSCIRCGHLLGFSIEEGDMLTLRQVSQVPAANVPAAHKSIGQPAVMQNPMTSSAVNLSVIDQNTSHQKPAVREHRPAGEAPAKTAAVHYVDVSDPTGPQYRLCSNATQLNACNWVIPAEQPHDFCVSCRLTEVLPPMPDESRRKQWVRVESAKRRLLYTLIGLGLPVQSREQNANLGLAFRFEESTAENPVYTGHASGVITLNMAEANHAFRENAREKLGEVYRTVLGHLRHECGHYYWELLVLPSAKWLPKARAVFGDEQVSYQEAITRHYEEGAPANWSDHYISAYATMHPWEDWAETWAHYLHMLDTLETAAAYDLAVKSPSTKGKTRRTKSSMSHRENFDKLFEMWYSLTFVLNGLSRSMGMPDTYPFVISHTVKEKLRLVHDIILDLGRG